MVNRVIHLESDYEYVSGEIMGNIMNLQAAFSTGEWATRDLQIISNELVNTAKWFAVQQGLGAVDQIQDYSINGTPVYINRKKRKRTGTLIRSIHAKPKGNTVVFWNDANLGRGYYAGHIEYGFHDRGGNPVAARPFMRPAFQAVARASRNELAKTLHSFLSGGLIRNVTARFATPETGSYRRAFYSQPSRGPNSGFRTITGLKNQKVPGAMSVMRERGTVRRDGNMKGFIKSTPKTITRTDSVTKRLKDFSFSPAKERAKTYDQRKEILEKNIEKHAREKEMKKQAPIRPKTYGKGNMLYGESINPFR